MSARVGLWVDRKKAVALIVTDTGEEFRVIVSKAGMQPPQSGNPRFKATAGPLPGAATEESGQGALAGHLNRHYRAVIVYAGETEFTLVYGPGRSRGKARQRSDDAKNGRSAYALETVDEKTNRIIAAKVCSHFPTRKTIREDSL